MNFVQIKIPVEMENHSHISIREKVYLNKETDIIYIPMMTASLFERHFGKIEEVTDEGNQVRN